MAKKNGGKEVVERQPAYELEMLREPMALGEVFAKSGMFPDIKTQAQAVVKILAGKELGVAPFEAMTNIYIVNNKLALASRLMASLLRKTNKYDYNIDVLTNTECTLSFYRTAGDKRTEIGKSTFTFKDAAAAGLVNKDNWKNYPRNMLFARALSNGIRWYTPEVVCGYTVEEVEDIYSPTTNSMETIEITDEGEVENGS